MNLKTYNGFLILITIQTKMEFNKIIIGADKAVNDEEAIYEILDAGFLCHIAFPHKGQTMMLPTAYGRKDDAQNLALT